MRAGWLAVAGLFLASFGPRSLGQPVAMIEVEFSHPGLTPSHWTLVLHPDGSGHFRSDRGNATAEGSPRSSTPSLVTPDQDRDVQFSAQFVEHVFHAARKHKLFSEECESHMKVAFQGWKKLSYSGPDGEGSCKFNYSNDKEIQALGDSMVAAASTILEGARLEMLLQHDRLGLDKEMEYISEAQGDGRILQICAIRGILERLEADPAVMERVRKRARALLAKQEE